MKSRLDKALSALETAKPLLKRLSDSQTYDHLNSARLAAQNVKEDVLPQRTLQAIALRVASDQELRDEIRLAVTEVQEAVARLRGNQGRGGQKTTLLLLALAAATSGAWALLKSDKPQFLPLHTASKNGDSATANKTTASTV